MRECFLLRYGSTIESDLQLLEQRGRVGEERPLSEIRKGLQKIDSILREAFPSHPIQNELDWLKAVQSELMAEIEGIKVHFQALKSNVKTKEEGAPAFLSEVSWQN